MLHAFLLTAAIATHAPADTSLAAEFRRAAAASGGTMGIVKRASRPRPEIEAAIARVARAAYARWAQ